MHQEAFMQPEQTSHVLDRAIALVPQTDHTFAGRTSPAYANAVGPFGGVIAATLLNAVVRHPERLGEPVSLTVHYAAPVADGPFMVSVRTMRTNRSTQHWLVELLQKSQVATYASIVTGIRRETWSATDAQFPELPPPDALAPAAPLDAAPWTHCYEMRFVDGVPGAEDGRDHPSQTRVWMRDLPERPLDFQSLAAISDAFLPRLFVRRPRQVPFGTVALTTYFHADAAQLAAHGTAPLLGVARGLHFGKGFFDQSAEIWNAGGALLATSHQVVYFKE